MEKLAIQQIQMLLELSKAAPGSLPTTTSWTSWASWRWNPGAVHRVSKAHLLISDLVAMSTRIYPIYQRGNPQLRIFLPNFWMKLTKMTNTPRTAPNVAHFEVSPQMTKVDVKNYLEQIYKIPVVNVFTVNLSGKSCCYDIFSEWIALKEKRPSSCFLCIWVVPKSHNLKHSKKQKDQW